MMVMTDEERRARYWELWEMATVADIRIDLIHWNEVCPDCGLDDKDAEHRADCPRVNTCGQTTPYLNRPFHREPSFDHLEGRARGDAWHEWLNEHRRTEHAS